jgi:hypothetical protein
MDLDKTSINELDINLGFQDMCANVAYSSPRIFFFSFSKVANVAKAFHSRANMPPIKKKVNFF